MSVLACPAECTRVPLPRVVCVVAERGSVWHDRLRPPLGGGHALCGRLRHRPLVARMRADTPPGSSCRVGGEQPSHLAVPLCFPQARPGLPPPPGAPNFAVSFSGSGAAKPRTRPFSLLSWFPRAAALRAGGWATRLPCPVSPIHSAPALPSQAVSPLHLHSGRGSAPTGRPCTRGPTDAQSPARAGKGAGTVRWVLHSPPGLSCRCSLRTPPPGLSW